MTKKEGVDEKSKRVTVGLEKLKKGAADVELMKVIFFVLYYFIWIAFSFPAQLVRGLYPQRHCGEAAVTGLSPGHTKMKINELIGAVFQCKKFHLTSDS